MVAKVLRIVGIIITAIVVGACLYWLTFKDTNSNDKYVEYIAQHIHNGHILDWSNDLHVQSVDDIKWYEDSGDRVVIEYGIIKLTYYRDDLLSDETKEKLNTILIDVKLSPYTGKLHVYWDGKEVEKHVKI